MSTTPGYVTLWRGTTVEVGSDAPPPIAGWIVHDLGPALYTTTQQWLSEQYAYTRYSEAGRLNPATRVRPVLLRATVAVDLIYGPDTMDLTRGPAALLWRSYMTGENPYGMNYLKTIPSQRLQQGAYQELLAEFVRIYGQVLALPRTPRVIIAPEYVRGTDVRPGIQVAIIDRQLRELVARSFREWGPPIWIRVKDRSGAWMDVDINDPRNGLENRRYVEERFQAASRQAPGSQGARERRGTVSPGASGPRRGVKTAVGLLAVEATLFGLDLYSAFKSRVTEAGERRRKVLAVSAFWSGFGVSCQIFGLATQRGGKDQIVIRGAEDWSGIELFPALVHGFLNPPETNPLDLHIGRVLDLLAFLHLGSAVGALVPSDADRALPPHRRRWYVRLVAATSTNGGIKLDDQFIPISHIVLRIWDKVLQVEEDVIAGVREVGTPYRSAARRAGAEYLTVQKSAYLVFRPRESWSAFATQARPGRSGQAILTWSPSSPVQYDSRGRPVTSFFQVGEKGVGDPAWLDGPILVTGANPTTNVSLYEALLQNDGDGLKQEVTRTGLGGTSGDTYETTYTVLPLVYVEGNSVGGILVEE